MELFWTPEAIQGRDDIYDYIETDNPTAALAFDELFSEKATLLVDHPNLGRLGRAPDTRGLVAHRNYLLVYDMDGDVIRMLNVFHAARQRPPFQESR
jgi:addiction module RelE/StbE family toxin